MFKILCSFLVSDFLPSSAEQIFGTIAIIFASDNVFCWGIFGPLS